ncbi:MAG TPA: PAAR domain-containing protein, partial [Gemmataceae bacterium]|nr:PAAR domain-containing protein [Gemmataceae bacterium]
SSVEVNGRPVAVVGDACVCVGPPDKITAGVSSIEIEGHPAADGSATTDHGGTIAPTCADVMFG